MSRLAMKSERGRTAAYVSARRSSRPEKHEIQIAVEILSDLPERSREALIRYFLGRHSAEKIQSDLNFSAEEFRDLKALARARWEARRGAPVCSKPASSERYAAQRLPSLA